ncbi:hypothetical protein BKA64DRAFT_765595 [Cadophora sp. MPI-SDFR-AT-0126]|nr:hypothetical protein BKA64DRAFT_765595 [Leotiomycetes sp. MPI-SDFR-AT-0126]
MPRFKRIHGDYTLDDLLDPELISHRHLPDETHAEAGAEDRSKKRRIMEALPQEGDNKLLSKAQNQLKTSSKAAWTEKAQSIPLAATEPPRHAMPDRVDPSVQSSSSATRITLENLELFVKTDKGFLFWDPRKQKMVPAMGFSKYGTVHCTDHGNGFSELLRSVAQVFVLAASLPVYSKLFAAIPVEIFHRILSEGDGISWAKHCKTWLIRHQISYAIGHLKINGIWPPSDASSELR